jgi:hypothetical protein
VAVTDCSAGAVAAALPADDALCGAGDRLRDGVGGGATVLDPEVDGAGTSDSVPDGVAVGTTDSD